MNEQSRIVRSAADIEAPVAIGSEAYVSPDYARAESERLRRKARLQAGRLEDIAGESDFITFDIGDDSVIVVRDGPDSVRAFNDVCAHRGRWLIDTPKGQRNARGNKRSFICGVHG